MGFLCFGQQTNEDEDVVRYNPNNPLRERNQRKIEKEAKERAATEKGKGKGKAKEASGDSSSLKGDAAEDDVASIAAPPEPPAPKKRPPKNPPWKVKNVKIYDGLVSVGAVKTLFFKKKKCVTLCNVLASITRHPTFYEEEPEIRLPLLLNFLDRFKQQVAYNNVLEPIVDYLEWEYEEETAVLDAMIANGEVLYDGLWYLFKLESRFITHEYDEPVGALVTTRDYEFNAFGGSFRVNGTHVTSNGRQLSYIAGSYILGSYSGLRDIKNLRVRPMTEDEHAYLHKRGLIFREVALGSHYKQYDGNMFFSSGWATEKFKANGRVMVDPTNFSRFNADYRAQFFVHATAPANDGYQQANVNEMKEIPDKQVFTCVPTISGFSLTVKRWGQMHVKYLADIKFDSKAFDQLVMDENRKKLVKSLVENSSQSFTDIITGKGGGCVFLLYGPPGTGKTVTSEAIADLLERPLYSVTVGELGVNTRDLEAKLRQILELAWEWDAVLLIDEADIFLERRTQSDIKRNAMVGIFLRLLEYHQGVLFLTSNRVKSFDEAFHSRISVALHYEALDKESRSKVFENLLAAAGISGLDTNKLGSYELNGRQIRSTIRLAQSLAFSEGVPVTMTHVERTVDIARQFQEDLASDVVANEPCNT